MKKLIHCFVFALVFALPQLSQAQNFQTWDGQGVQFSAPAGFAKGVADAEKFEGKVEGASIHHLGLYSVKETVNKGNVTQTFKTLAQEAGLTYFGTQNFNLGNLEGIYAQGTVSNIPAYFAVLYDASGSIKFNALIVHNNPYVAMAILNSLKKK